MLTQTDVLISTRIYHDLNPLTGEEYELRGRLLRTGERSFVLMVAGEKPGDPEIAKSISLAACLIGIRIVRNRLSDLGAVMRLLLPALQGTARALSALQRKVRL
jgi:hypothetical protein